MQAYCLSGKGLRRISKSNWCKERHDLTSVRSAKLICTGYHFLYIQNRSGDHYRVILKFLRTWRTASGSFLGNILYYAQSISVLSTKLYMWVPAGVVLVLTVLSINFIGDGIRDALDTKMKI